MNADGKNLINITNHPTSDLGPAWSPDGTLIAFYSFRDHSFEIYVMNADGKNPINLTNNVAHDTSPAWSPDGSKIAFQSDRDERLRNFEIYLMNTDGTNQVNLTNHPAKDFEPAWSPASLAVSPKENLLPTFWAKIKRLKLSAGRD